MADGCGDQLSVRRFCSSSTSSDLILPLGARVAMRVMAALRSRKFPFHVLDFCVAKWRNCL